MAQKQDAAAAKARKQKIILAVFGVALLGVAVIQGPKLMKKSEAPVAEAAPAAVAASDSATAPTTAVVVSSTTGAAKPAGYVAGVGLPNGRTVVVASNKLASFTLFAAKDPFVQQASDEQAAASQAGVAVQPSTTTAAATETPTTGDAGASAPPPAPPIVYATITLDGKPQQLKVKEKFPKSEPLFVLVAVKKKQAKIGVAGGSFDDSKTVTLAKGKTVTLVDSATGVRYELKLVYTGSTPEQIESFSTAPSGGTTASSGETAAQTTTTADGTTAASTP